MKTTDMQNTTIQSAATQNSNMLNKLHMAMIELYKGDAKGYSISVRFTVMPG